MKLIALDAGKGDAFFLEDNDNNILVDTGNKEFLKLPKINHIDVIILTHSDIDHIKGTEKIISNPKLKISELWVPASFASINLFIKENINELKNGIYLEESIDNNNYDSLLEMEEESGIIPSEIFDSKNGLVRQDLFDNYSIMSETEKLILTEINTIVKKAISKNIQIRFLKPTGYETTNKINNFALLNSEEISTIPRIRKNNISYLVKYLRLTLQNKYSLVIEYATCENYKVLFSGDSDYFFIKSKRIFDNYIITVPHHGSESNKNAYRYFGKKSIFIRSGGTRSQLPGNTFETLANKKICNCCYMKNEINYTPAVIEIINNSIFVSGILNCNCVKIKV